MLAAGTISFFGGRRLVMLPLIRPSTYSDKDLQELCDTLADTDKRRLRADQPDGRKVRQNEARQAGAKADRGMRKTWATAYRSINPAAPPCRKWPALGQRNTTLTFAQGAEAALLDRCGDDQFLLQNVIAKLAALSGYTTITTPR